MYGVLRNPKTLTVVSQLATSWSNDISRFY